MSGDQTPRAHLIPPPRWGTSSDPNDHGARELGDHAGYDGPMLDVAMDNVDRLGEFMRSDDMNHRLAAQEMLAILVRANCLPDQTWCVFSTYKDGWGGDGRRAIWTAHWTEANARLWLPVIDKHWQDKDAWRPGGTNYFTQVGQLDYVSVHYLRRLDADPNLSWERSHV